MFGGDTSPLVPDDGLRRVDREPAGRDARGRTSTGRGSAEAGASVDGVLPGRDDRQPAGRAARGRPAVLHVVTDTTRRGAQLFGLQLHRILRRQGWPSDIVALAPGEPDEALGIPTLGPSRLCWRTLRALRRRLRGTDVAIAHGSTTLPACAIATLGTTTPFVYRSIGDPRFWTPTPSQRMRTGLLLHRAAAVTALWERAADELARRFHLRRRNVVVIPHGVPAGHFLPPSTEERRAARNRLGVGNDRTVLACLGSLSWEKNVSAAVEAMRHRPGDILLVMGEGPLRGELEEQSRRLPHGRVRFLGTVADPVTILRAVDVLLMPSRTEGTPGAAIEAGLMGIPVVASAVGGLPRVVADGVTGRLLEEPDPTDLATAVGEVLDRDGTPRSAIRRHLLRHDLGIVADHWKELLASVGADHRSEAAPRDPDAGRSRPPDGTLTQQAG